MCRWACSNIGWVVKRVVSSLHCVYTTISVYMSLHLCASTHVFCVHFTIICFYAWDAIKGCNFLLGYFWWEKTEQISVNIMFTLSFNLSGSCIQSSLGIRERDLGVIICADVGFQPATADLASCWNGRNTENCTWSVHFSGSIWSLYCGGTMVLEVHFAICR